MKAQQLHPHGDFPTHGDRPSARSPAMRRQRRSQTIAVVSDGSALNDVDPAARAAAAESLLHEWAAAIRDQTGLIARPLNLSAHDTDDVAGLPALPHDVRVVIVVGTDAAHCGPVAVWAADRRCAMVTDRTITAVSAAAELLSTLRRRGLPPSRSRVLIAGAASAPLLARILVAARVCEVISWDRRDAGAFPLHHVIPDAGIVIDLVGCRPEELAQAAREHPGLIVMTPDRGQPPTGTLASVLHAVIDSTQSTMSTADYYSCVLSSIAATPSGRHVPSMERTGRPAPLDGSRGVSSLLAGDLR